MRILIMQLFFQVYSLMEEIIVNFHSCMQLRGLFDSCGCTTNKTCTTFIQVTLLHYSDDHQQKPSHFLNDSCCNFLYL